MTANCSYCGNEFPKTKYNKIYCSPKCKKASRGKRTNVLTTDKCKCGCGNTVTKQGNSYISGHNMKDSNLIRDYKNRVFKPKVCNMCNNTFTPTTCNRVQCDNCRPNVRYMKFYNLTLNEVKDFGIKQGNKCAICGRGFTKNRRFCIDHSHTTGKVRGLLCFNCNTGLGNFRDKVETLQQAIQYLS